MILIDWIIEFEGDGLKGVVVVEGSVVPDLEDGGLRTGGAYGSSRERILEREGLRD